MSRADLNQPEIVCSTCGKIVRVKPSKLTKKKYCSRQCMAVGYRERMQGDDNPNFRNANRQTCNRCGKIYCSYDKRRKYCSKECYSTDPKVIGRLRAMSKFASSKVDHSKLRGKRVHYYCTVCKQIEVASKIVKYCNHCRKGTRVMKVGRVDKNQNKIVKAFHQVGASVFDTSKVGGGFPDLVVAFQGETHLIEVKNPENSYGRKGLNKRQQEFSDSWRGAPVHIVRTVDDALKVIGVNV